MYLRCNSINIFLILFAISFYTKLNKVLNQYLIINFGLGLGLLCLTPLSTIFQLYRGCQFLVEEIGVPEEIHRPDASN